MAGPQADEHTEVVHALSRDGRLSAEGPLGGGLQLAGADDVRRSTWRMFTSVISPSCGSPIVATTTFGLNLKVFVRSCP